MTETGYKRTLSAAVDELSKLMEKQESLESQMETLRHRIYKVRRAVSSLAVLCGIEPEKEYPDLYPSTIGKDVGFTDAVREVLKSGDKYDSFTPIQVRDSLRTRGFDLDKYKNPLASIHTILKRLHYRDEVEVATGFDGGVMYSWNWKKDKGASEVPDDEIPF